MTMFLMGWREWVKLRESKSSLTIDETEKRPDYSFDRWVQMAQELGDDVNVLVGHGKESEEKLDKSAKDKKAEEKPVKDKKTEEKSKKPEPKKPPEKEEPKKSEDETHKAAWAQLRAIHKERLKK